MTSFDHREESKLVKLVIGPNVYGKAATEIEALANARAEYAKIHGRTSGPGPKLPRYLVYLVHPESWVDGAGDISYPSEHKPILYKQVVNGKEFPLISND